MTGKSEEETKEYWQELGLVIDEVTRKKETYKKNLVHEFTNLEEEIFSRLYQALLKKKVKNRQEAIKEMLEGAPLETLCFIHEFARGEIINLREYFSKPKFNSFITEKDMEGDAGILFLVLAYAKSPDSLKEATYYISFKKNSGIARYTPIPAITESQDIEVKEGAEGIKRVVQKEYKRKFKPAYDFNDGSTFYHVFYREKETRVKKTYYGNKTITEKSDLFISLTPKDNRLEIRCRDVYVRETVRAYVQRKLGVKLVYNYPQQKADHLEDRVMNFLTEREKEGISFVIEQAAFEKAGCNPEAQMIVGKKGEVDIRHILKDLKQKKIVDFTDLRNIKLIRVRFKDESWPIQPVIDDNQTVVFKTREDLPTKWGSELNELLSKNGIFLNTPLVSEIKEEDFPKNFPRLLRYSGSRQLTLSEKELVDRMAKDSIIKTLDENILECITDRRHIKIADKNETQGKCSKCESPLVWKKEIKRTEPDYIGIRKYVGRHLANNFPEGYVKIRKKESYKDFPYFDVWTGSEHFYVYVESNVSAERLYTYVKSSLMPTVVVTTGSTKNSIAEDIFPKLSLQEVYFDTEDAIHKSFNELKTRFTERLEKAAIAARTRLEECTKFPEKSNEYDFEDDIFVLLRYIWGTGEQWGHKLKKTVPDGVIGLNTFSKGFAKTHKVSFIWDCKYGNNPIDLSDETLKRQARDYIMRTNKSKEIRKFSNNLGAFIVVTNHEAETGADGFADWQYKYRRWQGSVVILRPSALITLYEYLSGNTKEFQKTQASVLASITSILKRPKDDTAIIFDKMTAEEVIKQSQESIKSHNVDINRLTEHLVSNVI